MLAGISRRMILPKMVSVIGMLGSGNGSASPPIVGAGLAGDRSAAARPMKPACAQQPRWASPLALLLPRHFGAAADGMRERATVYVFQFATQRLDLRQAAVPHAILSRQLIQVVYRVLALYRGSDGDDHPDHLTSHQER